MQEQRGRFITFEGPEGCGKTTQIERLAAVLQAKGLEVLTLREPGGTSTGEAIRGLLQHDVAGEPICAEAEALLFAASRAQLVRRRILPALEAGTWVLCDRFADSTTAYQGYGRGFGREAMETINAFAINGARPDLTLLLDMSVERARKRIETRSHDTGRDLDRIEREAVSFHERVRAGYLDLAATSGGRFVVIDADRDADAVAETLWSEFEQRFAIAG